MTRRRAMPPTHNDLSKCRQCQHFEVGGSSAFAYCRAGPPQSFCHQMRQPGAPCGPSAFLFAAQEGVSQ